MTKKVTPISFVPRFFGAFGQFFKYLSSADYAGRCQLINSNEKFAFEVPETIVKEVVIETVTEIREVTAPRLETVSVDGAYQLLQLMQLHYYQSSMLDLLNYLEAYILKT